MFLISPFLSESFFYSFLFELFILLNYCLTLFPASALLLYISTKHILTLLLQLEIGYRLTILYGSFYAISTCTLGDLVFLFLSKFKLAYPVILNSSASLSRLSPCYFTETASTFRVVISIFPGPKLERGLHIRLG
jgi:hypothetical protein